MRSFILGILSTLVLCALVGTVLVVGGLVDVSALSKGGVLDSLLAYASGRSIDHHSQDVSNPFQGDEAAIAVGLDHYKENCLVCHAAPGLRRTEIARGLNPPAPPLATDDIRGTSDGQLFWVVSNGIRMTGMPAFSPTHTEEEIWKIVSFVRHLDSLTDEETAELRAGTADESEHHHEEGGKVAQDQGR